MKSGLFRAWRRDSNVSLCMYRSTKSSTSSSQKHVVSSKTLKPTKPAEEAASDSDEIDAIAAPAVKSKEHRDKSKSVDKVKDKVKDKERSGERASASQEKAVAASEGVAAKDPSKKYKASDDEIVENWEKWDLRGNDVRGEEARKNLRGVVERVKLFRKLNPGIDITEVDLFDELKENYQDYMVAYPDGPRHHKDKDPEAQKAKKLANAARKSALAGGDSSKRAKILEYPVEALGDKAQEIRALYLQLQATSAQASAFLAQLAVTEKNVQNMLRTLDENDME